uniref:DMR6-like oxygenase 2 n=1 Tax=Papaver somniferum TaxID=3469 RepID=A0A5B7LLA2_PAPSO|nr:DMR6-like oxygenase 2 [Papaver somniferum]
MGSMIKDLIESTDHISVPNSKHALPAKAEDLTMLAEVAVEQVSLPVIDFSLLTSGSPNQRSKIVEELRNACLHWGFFMRGFKGVHKRSREIMKELIRAIMEGLELEDKNIEESLELNSGVQKFSANLNPPCPQPELAIGLPPHADRSLLTLLIKNDVGGLQIIKNKGKWVAVNAIPNSIMVNIGDHMEVRASKLVLCFESEVSFE